MVEYPSGCAIHQWKRGKEYRKLICAPKGATMIEADFAGQEFRWMAVESGDHTMLQMCMPGEDAHSFMGARCTGVTYEWLRENRDTADGKPRRQLGKVANLSCIAHGQLVLTDRGPVPIQDVALSDKVWDGGAWVPHDGLVHRGTKEVLSYGGIVATPDHKVLVDGAWVRFDTAAAHGWSIEPSVGAGWAGRGRAAVRIVDGVVRRAVSALRRALCESSLHVRPGEGRQPSHDGGGQVYQLQGLCYASAAPPQWTTGRRHAGGEAAAEACERDAPAVHQPPRRLVPQLRRTRDRVQVLVREGRRGVHSVLATCAYLYRAGHRPGGQQRPLRAGQPEAVHEEGERRQQATYDLLNAGPRARFSVGPCVVSNCQYRTSPPTLMVVAKVQHKVSLTLPEATSIRANYLVSYPGVKRYWKRQIDRAKRYGYVDTMAGRRVQLGDCTRWRWYDDEGQMQDWEWAHQSTAINFPIQGVGADQKYLGLMVLKDYLNQIGGRFYFELHDGLFFIVPEHLAEKAAHEIKKILSNLPYKQAWGVTLPIEFPVDAKFGPSWGELKEI